MAFQWDKPQPGLASSAEVRANFQAIAIHHQGSVAPTDPHIGYLWIDTSDPDNWLLRVYSRDGLSAPRWVDLVKRVQSDAPVAANGAYYDTRNPDANDDIDHGFDIGDLFLNVSTGAMFYCVNSLVGNATWKTFFNFTDGDTGDLAYFDGTSWQAAQYAAQRVDYLVGPAGQAKYTSIQDAIDAASSGDTVWVLPGTYTEDLTLKDGVDIRAVILDDPIVHANLFPTVTLVGSLSVSTAAVDCNITGLKITPSSGTAILDVTSGSGDNRKIKFKGCDLRTEDAEVFKGVSVSNGQAFMSFDQCDLRRDYSAVSGAVINVSGGFFAGAYVTDCKVTNTDSGGTAATISNGAAFIARDITNQNGTISGNIHIASGSNNMLRLNNVMLTEQSGDEITIDGSLWVGLAYMSEVRTDSGDRITVGGANAAQLMEIPGDLVRHDYLVGQVNSGARYTSIQDAIDAASAGDTVYVLPGTYVENLTLKDDVNVFALGPEVTKEVGLGYWSVILTGAMTWAPAAGGVRQMWIRGIDINPPAGSSCIDVNPAAGAIALLQCDRCDMRAEDALPVDLGTGSTLTSFTLDNSAISRVYTAADGPVILLNEAAQQAVIAKSQLYAPSGLPSKNALDISGGATVTILDCNTDGSGLWGKIDVSGGSNNTLTIKRTTIAPYSGEDHVVVTGTLAAASNYHEVYDRDTYGRITISGTNADQLTERPGDSVRYEYLVSTAGGGGRYTAIQDAIDQAVADGHDNSNPTYIHILPGTYTENLSLKPGVHLLGTKTVDLERAAATPDEVQITGDATFAYDDAGSTSYVVELHNIRITGTATQSPLTLSGSSRKTVTINNTRISQGASSYPLIDMSGQTQRIFLTASGSSLSNHFASTYPIIELTQDGSSFNAYRSSCLIYTNNDAIKVSANSCFVNIDTGTRYADNASIFGRVHVVTGTTNTKLVVENSLVSNASGTEEFLIDGTLLAGSCVYRSNRDAGSGIPGPVRIAGTNADDLVISIYSAQQHLYVGKHGSDSYDGLTPERAFLTIGAAITAAGTPASEAAAVTIEVLDDGEYDEDLTHVSYVNVHAPYATLKGQQTLVDDTTLVARRLINDGDNVVLYKAVASTGRANVECVALYGVTTTQRAFSIQGGSLTFKAKKVTTNFGCNALAADIYLDVLDWDAQGGDGLAASAGGNFYGHVAHLHGTAGSTGLIVALATGSTFNLSIDKLNCATAYNITASNTLRLVTSEISGTETIAAGADVRVYGQNITFDTITGTKIGSAATQKLALWGATPIVQPSSTGETSGFAAGTGTGVNDDSTFTGNVGATAYTLGDIVKHLKNAGIIAQ